MKTGPACAAFVVLLGALALGGCPTPPKPGPASSDPDELVPLIKLSLEFEGRYEHSTESNLHMTFPKTVVPLTFTGWVDGLGQKWTADHRLVIVDNDSFSGVCTSSAVRTWNLHIEAVLKDDALSFEITAPDGTLNQTVSCPVPLPIPTNNQAMPWSTQSGVISPAVEGGAATWEPPIASPWNGATTYTLRRSPG